MAAAISASLSVELGRGGDFLDRCVLLVRRRDEFTAREVAQDLRVGEAQNGLPHPVLEARAELLVDIATDRELIVRECRAFPDHRYAALIDPSGLLLDLVDRIVHDADLIGTRLHKLKCARMVAREADPTEDLVRLFAGETFADEVFGHHPPRGGRARAEQKGLALDPGWEILGELQARFAVGDEVALEADILRTLGDRFGA